MKISVDRITGKRKFTGLPSLKDTQHYPPGFGNAVAALYAAHVNELRAAAASWAPARPIRVDGNETVVLSCMFAGGSAPPTHLRQFLRVGQVK